MLGLTRQRSSFMLLATRVGGGTAALVACLLPMVEQATAQGQVQTSANAEGHIYVSASYRFKPEGSDEEKTVNGAIIAIDPTTGDWQMIVEQRDAPRLSPDRRTLIFGRYRDGIWKCEADGQFPFKIFDKDGRPAWSADGKHLVVTKEKASEDSKEPSAPVWHDESWQIDPDGRNPVRLPIPDTDSINDWSPDGEWFVTLTDRHPPYGRGYQLYLMKTDGTQERRLTQDGLNVFARFSPDGKKILYLHQTRAEGNSIWTVDVDGENATPLVTRADSSTPDCAFWSPNGQQIAVILNDRQPDDNGRMRRVPRIEIVNADGTKRRQLALKGAKLLFIGSLGDWR